MNEKQMLWRLASELVSRHDDERCLICVGPRAEHSVVCAECHKGWGYRVNVPTLPADIVDALKLDIRPNAGTPDNSYLNEFIEWWMAEAEKRRAAASCPRCEIAPIMERDYLCEKCRYG